MNVFRILCFIFSITFFSQCIEASPEPCRYENIVDAYNAAEVVVTGKVVGRADDGFNLRFQVTGLIKGESDSEIVLEGQRPVSTELIGFTLNENEEVFLLLRKVQNGLYGAVETYNGPCQVYYFVVDGKVVLEEGSLGESIETIKDYFTQTPLK